MTERTVTTRGTGRETAPAETARIELHAKGGGPTAAVARAEAEDLTATLRRDLADAPCEVDLAATDFRVDDEERLITGEEAPYSAVHELLARCPPGDAREVVETASAAGASVSVTTFGLTEEGQEALYDRALEAAMADARRKARVAATAEGASVAGLHAVEVDQRSDMSDIVDAALNGDVQLDPSDVAIEVEVDATYALD